MLHLLKIEWLKVKNYRAFWILCGLFAISIYGANSIAHRFKAEAIGDSQMATTLVGTPFQFPDVWQTVTYISSYLLFIPGLLIITLVTNEFTFRTHRQNIIDGISRTQFIYTRMVLSLIIAIVSTILVFLAGLLFGSMQSGGTFSFKGMEYLFYFFLQTLSYTSVGLLFGILFKRAGIAIGIFFIYAFILENMLAGILNRILIGNGAGSFLPLESADSLIPFPFLRALTSEFTVTPPTAYLLVACTCYLIAYFVICKLRFERSDL